MTSDTTDNLRGKGILVTGGTTGIGLAIARSLLRSGARVFTFARDENEVRRTVEDLKSLGDAAGTAADSSSTADVERVFAEADRHFGRLDVLVNNAAVAAPGKSDEIAPAEIERVIRTNVVGYLTCCHHAIRRMRLRGGGHVVNIGSMSADLREAGGPVYTATKAAIQAFTESLRKDVNGDGIRVSLIEPGAVDTPIWDRAGSSKPGSPESLEMLTPEDVAEAVLFCLTRAKRCDVVSVQIRPLKQLI